MSLNHIIDYFSSHDKIQTPPTLLCSPPEVLHFAARWNRRGDHAKAHFLFFFSPLCHQTCAEVSPSVSKEASQSYWHTHAAAAGTKAEDFTPFTASLVRVQEGGEPSHALFVESAQVTYLRTKAFNKDRKYPLRICERHLLRDRKF